MKKIVSILLAALMVVSAVAMVSCSKDSGESSVTPRAVYTREYAGTTLNVFNWGEYISDGIDGAMNVNKEFEKLTGIHVNYNTYDSNESMYAKLKSGAVSYDIVIPSDYMIERMIKENMVQPIDFSKITNYDLIAPEYKDLFFDPENKFSVPYNVGMVGLIYNTTMVDEEPDSWEIMWNEKYKDDILMFDNPRDAFAIAQFLLGIDPNSTDKADWDKAADKLIEQNKIIQGRVMDQVFEKMEGGNAAIAPYYAGDYLTMLENNEDLAFVYPKEGTNIFVDSICVPSNASNYAAAMMYINFLLEPDVALANAEYLCYASPNTSVFTNPDYSYYEDEILYPTEENMPKTEYFHDIDPEIRSYYEKLWEKVILS